MFLRGEEMPKREPEMIYFLHEWMTVAEVEKRCRDDYRVFDKLLRIVRVAINAGDA
jgi:IS1 family transposase